MSFGSKEDSENLRSESSFSNTESFHSQYILGKTISHGGRSNVKLAHHRLTGTPVAVKMIPKQENWCHPVTSEVESMMTLNHPNIISLFQVIKTEKRVYLIMELCEGKSLYHHILEAGHLQEDEARAIFTQILHAMNYCHDQGIVHRDLKPDNIMIDSNGKIKVIDFGLSAQVKPGQRLSYHCGTFPFAAPELLLGRLYDGHKLDVWTLGIFLYLMITGRVPFDASNLLHFRRQVVSGKYPVPSRLSRKLQDLVRLLLTADPKQRPTIGEVLKHPWVREDSQVFTHPCEELPTLGPDVAIIKAMGHLGFREEDIKDSLFCKKYNQAMACYSFLKQQAVKQHECDSLTRSKPMNPLRTPLPSPDDPATFNLEQSCREMQRALHWSSYTSEGHFTPRERRARSVSWPGVLPCRTLQTTPTMGQAHISSRSAPCISSMHFGAKNSQSKESTADHPTTSAKDMPEPSRGPPRGFKWWARKMGRNLLSLCCCIPTQNRSRLRQKKISPQK
ncbi:sperm motility kinase 2B-like [Apodemus sylvaticus]|uniref:sperm motility kinase 2B-like n=1 Tax=Apodemus sylvaticus TaxID=10129 RepID=UPI0022436078|nr:sperm motility kinase 2B-like [Apodemus sylvaticus]